MQNTKARIWCGLLLATFVVGVAIDASAAEVRAAVSTHETYVGLPITLQIQISNASSFEPPALPEVDGLDITSLGTPSHSTQVSIINGVTSRNSSVIYAYRVTPQRTGNFRIPPITVEADGRQQQTPAIDLVASKSDTGDLMFVEVAGKEKQIYVGQDLDLTLRVWLRPYRDGERNITLSADDMWRMISPQTNWGAFSDRVQELADMGQRPASQEVLRKDRSGEEHSYYLYEIDATIYPQRPGRIDANDVRVVVNYPTALGRGRDPFAGFFDDMPVPSGFGNFFGEDDFPSPFGPRLSVTSARPIVAEAKVEPIDVVPIPTVDRPADYRGAVGQYRIVTQASPSNVQAGDPINLLIGIVGTGPMELVQAPPLADLPELTADFKVPNEPLAGFVQDDRKVFSTTIRPRTAEVTQIPPIPFSYFDPHTSRFVTVHSQPIPVHVDPADTLALDAVVGRHASSGNRADRTGPDDGGAASLSLANYTEDDVLQHETASTLSLSWLAFLMAVPPAVVLAILGMRNRQRLFRARHWRIGGRRVERTIESAVDAAEVRRALHAHLARRLALNADSADVATVVGALRSSGHRPLAVRCERILNDSTLALGAGGFGNTATLDEFKREALQVLADLKAENRRLRARPKRAARQPKRSGRSLRRATRPTSTSLTVLVLAAALTFVGGIASAAESHASLTPQKTSTEGVRLPSQPEARVWSVTLTREQEEAILAEANASYQHALQIAGQDSAEAKQEFVEAAEKYQLLVDSGVTNSRLYFNLANAYLQSGQLGRAIANYRKSLRIDPTNRDCAANLAYAERSVATASNASDSDQAGRTFSEYLAIVHRWISPRSLGATFLVAWFVLWLAVGARLLRFRFAWRSVVASAVVVGCLAGGAYWLSREDSGTNLAIVVSPSVTLRQGDGTAFAFVDRAELHEGQAVELVKRRSDWLQVRTASGQQGWLAAPTVEPI